MKKTNLEGGKKSYRDKAAHLLGVCFSATCCDTQSAFKMCQQSAKEKLENELGVRLWQLNKMNQ